MRLCYQAPANHCNTFWIVTYVKTYGKKNKWALVHLTSFFECVVTLNKKWREKRQRHQQLRWMEKCHVLAALTLLCLCALFSHIGTQIYILNGTDPEGDPVRYGLTFEKGSREYFRVEPKSGNVTLIQELDREVSLFEATLVLKICQRCSSEWHLPFLCRNKVKSQCWWASRMVGTKWVWHIFIHTEPSDVCVVLL